MFLLNVTRYKTRPLYNFTMKTVGCLNPVTMFKQPTVFIVKLYKEPFVSALWYVKIEPERGTTLGNMPTLWSQGQSPIISKDDVFCFKLPILHKFLQ
jgi:hypothetical protein